MDSRSRIASDPWNRVLDLGGKRAAAITAALVLALLAHGTAAARVFLYAVSRPAEPPTTFEIEVTKAKDPEPAPPAPEPPKEEAPKEQPKLAPPPPPPKDAPPPPPPAAAQAGAVLTQAPDPNDPVDFTNSFISGSSATFAGGITQAGGTSARPVYNRAATAQGAPGGTGTAPAPPAPGPDKSRALSVGSKDWSCGDLFPSEADSEQIDEMLVPVEVTVGADGRVMSVNVLKDPGHGFGRAAVQCAKRQGKDSFNLALDHDGNPIVGKRAVNVRFTR